MADKDAPLNAPAVYAALTRQADETHKKRRDLLAELRKAVDKNDRERLLKLIEELEDIA